MKEEREVWLLVKLLNSGFKKRIIGKSCGGTKSDFAKYLEVSRTDKDFRILIKNLINAGCIALFEFKKTMGGTTETYVINEKKIWDRIKNTEFGKKFYDGAINNYTSF